MLREEWKAKKSEEGLCERKHLLLANKNGQHLHSVVRGSSHNGTLLQVQRTRQHGNDDYGCQFNIYIVLLLSPPFLVKPLWKSRICLIFHGPKKMSF